MFDPTLALEMLCACTLAETFRGRAFAGNPDPTSTFLNLKSGTPAKPVEVNASPIHDPVGIVGIDFKADTECFVARSEAGDVVVAFRSSETSLFTNSGALKDWLLTDLRSDRMPYPPAPGSTGDRRWVHSGFWQAYETVRERLIAEVARQADRGGAARRIHVTGFSLGGALAVLAALDLAQALPRTPVHLIAIAAPRTGDASLNRLLASRVRSATSIGFRGDPTIHVPPIGPNLPLTLRPLVSVDIAGLHVPLPETAFPQLLQHYQTPGDIVYIDGDYQVHERWPRLQVALNFRDHSFLRYRNALYAARRDARLAADALAAMPRDGRTDGLVQMMFAPPA